MKSLSFLTLLMTVIALPACAQQTTENRLNNVLTEACATGDYKYEGIYLGMTEAELAKLGGTEIKRNYPSGGSSSTELAEKTLIFWSTPENESEPVYRISYSKGATATPYTLDQGEVFIQEIENAFGEPKIKSNGKGYHDEGFPRYHYGPDNDVMEEKFKPVGECLGTNRGTIHTQSSLKSINEKKLLQEIGKLSEVCPQQVDAYFDYMTYALQPVIDAHGSKAKLVVEMNCPAYQKISWALKNAAK